MNEKKFTEIQESEDDDDDYRFDIKCFGLNELCVCVCACYFQPFNHRQIHDDNLIIK